MKKYQNPIIPTSSDGRTSDPYVIRFCGKYYQCYNKSDGVYISVSEELTDIGTAKETKVFDAPIEGIGSHWFAPELHRIDGVWYIYGAPQSDERGRHRMEVLKCEGKNPIGNYIPQGKVHGVNDGWSIDGTVLEHDGKLYFIWTSIREIFMSEMENPTKLFSKKVTLTKPEFPFETKTKVLVNEGPAILKHNGKIHIAYSANDSKTDEYCLGLLSYVDGDIMDVSNWKKSENAVFEKTDDIFGPGHCSFTTVTENGEDCDYIVYHANLESGSGWKGRSVWIQSVGWDENDMPLFGKPMH